MLCRYCYYHETQNILGNTYGMAVLQVRGHCCQTISPAQHKHY
jgi:tRNA(Met) C34 N-acetyltransferase TmcA